tara:strand:- start:816 stop:1508 length:693 start_codon:yes stop_codon:yes gene_type:complete
MNPKFLTGGLLIIGSLLIFAGFGESNDELITATDHVANIAEDTQSHLYFTLLDMTAVIAMMTGWIFLGLSMHGSSKSGSLLAKVAVTLTIICLPIVIVSSGLSLAVIYMIEEALKPENAASMGALMVEAEWLYIISEGVSSPGVIFNVIGIAWILIGIAMILQKNLPLVSGKSFIGNHFILGILVIIVGASLFSMNTIGDFEIVWIIGFMGLVIISLLTGILTITNRNID